MLLLYPELYLPDGETRHRDTHPEERRNRSPDSDAVRGEREREKGREPVWMKKGHSGSKKAFFSFM